MKNQYVGDIGDYGKYGLLRYLAGNGIKIGVNWYLTPDDSSNDGKHVTYLDKDADRWYDEELYLALKSLVMGNRRNVAEVEKMNLIKDAVYYHEMLDVSCDAFRGRTKEERRNARKVWHQAALNFCKEADLVFLDPDNGLVREEPSSFRESGKYVYAQEAADYYRQGQNVMYYCQKGRRTWEQWGETKNIMAQVLPEAILCGITFHRGTQRTYIFVVHPEDYKRYYKILTRFLHTRWSKVFTAEYVGDLDWMCRTTGEKLDIRLEGDRVMTIETTEGGDVVIRYSDVKNRSLRMSGEYFASYFEL